MLHEFLIGKRSELSERCKRKVAQRRAPGTETSDESFPLFYECVLAARAKGLRPELQRRSTHS